MNEGQTTANISYKSLPGLSVNEKYYLSNHFWFRGADPAGRAKHSLRSFISAPIPATPYNQTLPASFNWTEMRQLFYGTILLVMFSCNTKSSDRDFVEYVDGRQMLTVNGIKRNGEKYEAPRINLVSPDSARIGEEFLAKIFLSATD